MKWLRFHLLFYYFFIPAYLMIIGCSKPVLKMGKSLPSIIKEYRHNTLLPSPGMQKTGIYLKKDDLYSILATGTIDQWPGGSQWNDVRPEDGWPFLVRIGKNPYFTPFYSTNAFTLNASHSGDLYVGTKEGEVDEYGEPLNPEYYLDSRGSYSVDIIVWQREDYVQIAGFFEKMKEKDPHNNAITNALNEVNGLKEIYLAEVKTSQEIEKTKSEIQELKEKPISIKQEPVKIKPEERLPSQAKLSISEIEKKAKIDQLEAKLTKLTGILNELDEMKKKLAEERKKSILLAKKLDEREKKEKELVEKLKQSKKTPPIIVIASPKDESKVEVNIIHISGVAEDDQGLVHLEIYINNKPIKKKEGRGLRVTGGINPKRVNINERIPLEKGENQIRIRAVDSDGLWAEKTLTIQRSKIRRNVWAVIIGINDYPNVRKLKFAVNDAKAFYDHLVSHNYIPAENVTLLLDWEATLTKLRSTLGTHLKRKARKDDMVIIYFAGHGSTEKDVMSPDGDGLEKYLLPYDADPKDLYASALPMREISHIFNRVQSERLVFLADSCYSGASGGRTIGIAGTRSNISENFLDRVASGKGRVIITASGSNEVSAENEDLQHGVFTYYLIEGLQGKADMDKDGLITVDEVYRYVSEQVPRATGQEQHPVKKGTVEGQLILGVIE